MSTYHFKTTINCDACVSKVTPVLNANEDIISWAVDLSNPDKVLTVQSAALDEEQLTHALKKVGYRAERIGS